MNKEINELREKFKKYNIDGYVVPKNDDYFTEYSKINRLKIISNFSGSAGLAIILKDKNYLFTDGRAQNAKGEMATNRWHTDPAPTFDQTSQEGTSSQQTSTDPSKDPGLVNKDEMDARKKQEKEKKRQEKKKQRQDSKKARQNCRTYNGYFEKGKTTLNPDEKKTYVEFLDGCCDIFLKMNKNRLTKRITIAAESAEDGTLMRPYCQAVEYDTLEKV